MKKSIITGMKLKFEEIKKPQIFDIESQGINDDGEFMIYEGHKERLEQIARPQKEIVKMAVELEKLKEQKG